MNCGEEIRVKDVFGNIKLRLLSQCGERFLMITHSLDWKNGYLIPDWRAALRELVALTVPAKLAAERGMVAESAPGGMFASVLLTYPLSIKGMAGLFGVPANEVLAQLSDLAVQVD